MRTHATVRLCCFTLLAAANLLHAQNPLTTLSAAGGWANIAPGSIGVVYGEFQVDSVLGQSDMLGNLPTELAGYSLDFNGVRAQIQYVGPSQINFMVPPRANFGNTIFRVLTPSGGFMEAAANVMPVAPAIFTMVQDGREMGAVLNAVTFRQGPYSLGTPEIQGCDQRTRLAVYTTGLGLTTGRARARDLRAEMQDPGGAIWNAEIESATAAPGSMGVEQLNLIVPIDIRPGTILLRVYSNGVPSNQVQFDLGIGGPSFGSGACLGSVSLARTGAQFEGTVTLAFPAPDGGVAVGISSETDAAVPPAVVIPAGETSAKFAVVPGAGAQSIKVGATLNGVGRSATFDLGPACVDGVTLEADGVGMGMGLNGTVNLTDPAPASGMSVNLAAESTVVQLDSSVMVPPGRMSAAFSLSTAGATGPARVPIIAAGGCGGSNAMVSLVSRPCISGVSLSSSTVAGGGQLTGTVKLNAPALAGGLMVSLASNDPSVQVDSQIWVSEGQTTATFNVNAGTVTARTQAAVTAVVANCGSASTMVVVSPR